MAVAIVTIHWEHGYSAAQDGVELTLYYALLLFQLVVMGGGRLSLDRVLFYKSLRSNFS